MNQLGRCRLAQRLAQNDGLTDADPKEGLLERGEGQAYRGGAPQRGCGPRLARLKSTGLPGSCGSGRTAAGGALPTKPSSPRGPQPWR